jgi:hypothetical protein
VDVDFGLDWLDLDLSRIASHFYSSPDPSFAEDHPPKDSFLGKSLYFSGNSWLTKIQEESPCQRCSVTLNFITEIPKAQVFHVFFSRITNEIPKDPSKIQQFWPRGVSTTPRGGP